MDVFRSPSLAGTRGFRYPGSEIRLERAGFDKEPRSIKSCSRWDSDLRRSEPSHRNLNGKSTSPSVPPAQGLALINRMGSQPRNGKRGQKPALPPTAQIIGGNLGKNTLTPNEAAPADYLRLFRALYDTSTTLSSRQLSERGQPDQSPRQKQPERILRG